LSTHIQAEDLEMYLLGRLPEGGVSAVDSHLTACKECTGRLVECVRFVSELATLSHAQELGFDERRQEPRFPTDEIVSVQELNPFSPERFDGALLNVSRGGIGFRTGRLLEAGGLLKVRLKSVIAFGEVRYCAKIGDEFHVGVKLSEVV